MKKITLKQRKKSIVTCGLVFACVLFGVSSTNAQVQNNGAVFVGDNGSIYIGAGSYNFGPNPGLTNTTKTGSFHGKLIFAAGASWSGAADAHFLDGYGTTLGTSNFIFPVGHSGVYAPVAVTPSTNDGVDAAYYRANPATVGTALHSSLTSISTIEYWDIKGLADGVVTLTWRASSNVATLTNSTLASLAIAGWDGTKWVEIPATVDLTSLVGGASGVSAGSITSDAVVDINAYTAYTLASKANSCSPLVASSGNTKTWSGSWSPSAPTIADPVIINAPFAGSLACNSLVLNADITLTNGQNVEVVNAVTGAGKIIMSSQAAVVQRNAAAAAPSIELTKQTRGLKASDYVYWGTPITGNFFNQLDGAIAVTGTVAGAFDSKFQYNAGSGGGWVPLTATTSGKGFIMRIKGQAPFTTASVTDKINLKFTGIANNGDVTVAVANNPSSPNGGTSHNLLANPYPSAIDGEKFLVENTAIDGVIYVWQASNAPAAGTGNYTQADYLTFTLAGSVSPSGYSGTFDGNIASGQGFKVKSLVPAGNVTFTNCMRLTANNTNFYKVKASDAKQTVIRDRYKLNMTGSNGVFSQILVAYSPITTLGYDRLYDASRNSVSTAQLYSILDADGSKLAINARPSFSDYDVVALGISKVGTTSETFTISISDKEGAFATSGTKVFVHDKINNLYHDLGISNFNFTSNSTDVNNRFEIVYRASGTLSNADFNSLITAANIKDERLAVTATATMKEVKVFDLTGRLVQSYRLNNDLRFEDRFSHVDGTYIVKIQFSDGRIATQKLINR